MINDKVIVSTSANGQVSANFGPSWKDVSIHRTKPIFKLGREIDKNILHIKNLKLGDI